MLPQEAEIIGNWLKDEFNKEILNVCSSTGVYYTAIQPFIWEEVLKPLQDRGNRITNLDIKCKSGVDIVADCRNIPLPDNVYDIAIFTSSIEHMENPEFAVGEIGRVLKLGGYMIASAPGWYPIHKDPIDTEFRIRNEEEWVKFLDNRWNIERYTNAQYVWGPHGPANIVEANAYVTIIKARPIIRSDDDTIN